MNSVGGTGPRVGCCQRAKASKQIFQHRDELRVSCRHSVDRQEVGDAVEDQHEQHGACELQMQRLGK
jgi:hypothetical protein